jgi:tetratricopeptide (TPR) repeat protein
MCIRLWIVGVAAFPFIWIAGAQAEDCALRRLTEMPLVDNGGDRPIVTVLVDDQPRKMLLDTGGFWSMLDPSIAGAYKARPAPVEGLLGLNAIALSRAVKVPSVQLGIAKFSNIDFYLAPDRYVGADGTLGANWLQAFDIEIDPVKNTASFFSSDHCEGRVVYWPHQDVAEVPVRIDNIGHRITIPLVLNGEEITALIDTGSSETYLNLRTAGRLFDLTSESPGMQQTSSRTDRNGVTRTEYRFQFKSLKMGDITFNNPWLTLAPMSGPGPDMILGMHHLHALHLYFAYKERKLYATSARGDIAEQQAAAGAGTAPQIQHTPDPLDEINARNYFQAASVAIKARDYAGALVSVDKAMQLEPGYAPGYLVRARLYLAKGDREHAFQDAAEAGRLKPNDPAILGIRSAFYLSAADYDRAYKDADDRARLEPQSASALNQRCWVGAIMGRLDAALADCNAAVALEPKSSAILDSRGLVHLKAGRYDMALADYSAAITINKNLASSLYGRGLVKQKTGDAAGSADDIATAQKIDPAIAEHFGK